LTNWHAHREFEILTKITGLANAESQNFRATQASVLDPQGKAVTGSLTQLGFDTVLDTRVSKYIEITFTEDDRLL
jgi:hypothetical protein